VANADTVFSVRLLVFAELLELELASWYHAFDNP